MSTLVNHLWQSTFFGALAAMLALALRRHRAQTRYWIWLAASVKFAIPFSLLVGFGSAVEWRHAPVVRPALAPAVQQLAQPFAPAPPGFGPMGTPFPWPTAAFAVWLLGVLVIVARWMAQWRSASHALRSAEPLELDARIPVLSSPTLLEPGVFGIFRPVLLVPEGITGRLSPEQLRAILAHELCHVRRHDNLLAAFHMAIQAVFWFHPLVWWIGARLIEERERACDEDVIGQGSDPEAYACGIVNVCRLYLESPLPCAAGVTGADLKRRIAAIVSARRARPLTVAGKLLIAAAAVFAVAAPVTLGLLHAQDTLKFDVASIKPSDPDARGMHMNTIPGGLDANNVSLRNLIEFAYDVRSFQISGGPSWLATERFVIAAKVDPPEPSADAAADKTEEKRLIGRLRERTRTLMADRFQLVVHHESKDLPIYRLVQAKGGPKLQPPTERAGITRDLGHILGKAAEMPNFAMVLSFVLARPVVDETGLTDRYDFDLKWSEEFDGRQIAKDKGVPIPPDAHPPEGAASDPAGPSLFTAIEKQLGLKLEAGKGPVDIIVVDRAEKPTAN